MKNYMRHNGMRILREAEEVREPVELEVTPDDPIEVAADEASNAVVLSRFGLKMLMFGVEAHVWHLNCESNSTHLALKELYEGCDDLGDKLLESVLGISGDYIEQKDDTDEYKFGNLRYGENCIDKIIEMRNEAQHAIGICDDSGIENILADFCELCNSVVYKLRRLR